MGMLSEQFAKLCEYDADVLVDHRQMMIGDVMAGMISLNSSVMDQVTSRQLARRARGPQVT
jgi:hypothetical protein